MDNLTDDRPLTVSGEMTLEIIDHYLLDLMKD